MKIFFWIKTFATPWRFTKYIGAKYLESDDRLKSNEDFFFKDETETVKDFCQIPDAIQNTLVIAQKCSFFRGEIT